MRTRRTGAVTAMAVVATLLVAACGSDDGSTPSTAAPTTQGPATTDGSGSPTTTPGTPDTTPMPSEPSGTLIAGATAEPASLDPIFETNLASTLVFMSMYDTLIEFTPELGYSMQIADGYDVADDGLSITFTIRDGVTFHSGREVTADDVVYSFDRLRSEESINKGLYSLATGIEATDEDTVVFTLSSAAPNAFLAILAVAPSVIMDSEVVEAEGDLRRVDGGTGPFVLDSWDAGSQITLVANEDYWAEGQPGLAELVFKIVPDEVSAAAALKAGEINWFQFSDPLAASSIKDANGVVYTEAPSLAYTYLSFNVNHEPFDDPDVRQAISYALDRQEIVDIAIEGRGEPTAPVVPTQVELALPLSSFPSYAHSTDTAKKMLADAGVTDLSIKLTVNSANAAMTAAAPIVADQLGRAGIDVEIVPVESSVWLTDLTTQNYEMIFGGSGGYPNPDLPFFNSFTCEGAWNYSKICDPSFDELVVDARAATGDERVDLYHELQLQLVNELSPYLYLFVAESLWGWSEGVEGYTPLPLNERRFNTVTITK